MGTGIRRMKDLMRDAGLEAPEFTSDTFFHAVFRRSPEFSLKKRQGEAGRETTQKTTQKTAQKIIEYLRANPQASREELAGVVNITPDGVKFHLAKLRKTGMLRRVGPDKGGHWEVLK